MASGAAAVIAAAIARSRREIRDHFENAGAVDPAHATGYEPPDHIHERAFELMVGRGVLREGAAGHYWIDRDAMRLDEERRATASKVILLIVVAGIVIAVGMSLLAH